MVFEHRIVPGPSDRSYGIHVARLAGLPGAVISRAEHLLAELEAGAKANRAGLAAASASPAMLQPSFFAPAGPSPLEEALGRVDVDGLTPLEAIQVLYELRALAKNQEPAQ